jgi:hypothetical protein
MTLLTNDVWTKIAIGSQLVSILTNSIRNIEHERYWNNVVLARERYERPSSFRLHVGGIDDRELAGGEPLGGDEVQDLEGVFGRSLIVLVVRNQRAAGVGGDNFRRFKVLRRKRRLTTAGWTDEDDEG